MASPAMLADARPRGTTASRAAPLIVAAIVFGALWGWGARRVGEAPIEQQTGGQMVRLVDAGVPQAVKHDLLPHSISHHRRWKWCTPTSACGA